MKYGLEFDSQKRNKWLVRKDLQKPFQIYKILFGYILRAKAGQNKKKIDSVNETSRMFN